MASIGRNTGITYFGNNAAARNLSVGARGPTGPQGPAGAQGVSVVSATVNSNSELILTLSNSQTINAGVIPSQVWSKDDVIPQALGGIAAGTVGQTLDGLNSIQLLEKLLYPYQALGINSFTMGLPISDTVEVGTNCAAGSYSASWNLTNSSNLTANSISLSRGTDSLATGLNASPASITHPQYNYTVPTSLTFTVSAGQSQGANVIANKYYTWKRKIWYGKSNLTALTGYSDFSSFSSIFTQGLTSISSANYTFNATPGDDQYLYIIIPDTGSYSTFTEIGFDYPFENAQNIAFTNSLGVSLTYKYYRSTNATESSVTIYAGV